MPLTDKPKISDDHLRRLRADMAERASVDQAINNIRELIPLTPDLIDEVLALRAQREELVAALEQFIVAYKQPENFNSLFAAFADAKHALAKVKP